jgi:hypothetical protein
MRKRAVMGLWAVVGWAAVASAQTTQPALTSDGSWISSLISSLLNTAWGWLQSLCYWFLACLFDMGSWVLDLLIAAVPQSLWPTFGTIQQYVDIANQWVPVDLALTLLGAYLTFLAVFVSIKCILKLIPTIG